MVDTITKADFLSGYESGYISDIILVDTYLYGKDVRGATPNRYKVVRCAV